MEKTGSCRKKGQYIGYSSVYSYVSNSPITANLSFSIIGGGSNPNFLVLPKGVWIVTTLWVVRCTSGTPDTQSFETFVSIVNTAIPWDTYPSSYLITMFNGQSASTSFIDKARIVNTFVLTTSTGQNLYLWGKANYTTPGQWWSDSAELRITRIA